MSITGSSSLTIAANIVLFGAGIFFGVSIFMAVDIELQLLAIEGGSAVSLPSMHPFIRYYFIPIVALFVTIVAALLNLLIGRFHKISLPRAAWVFLGFGYSCTVSFLPFRRLLVEPTVSFVLAIFLSVAVVAYTRIAFGTRGRANDA